MTRLGLALLMEKTRKQQPPSSPRGPPAHREMPLAHMELGEGGGFPEENDLKTAAVHLPKRFNCKPSSVEARVELVGV